MYFRFSEYFFATELFNAWKNKILYKLKSGCFCCIIHSYVTNIHNRKLIACIPNTVFFGIFRLCIFFLIFCLY
jgi:hypothetical protein